MTRLSFTNGTLITPCGARDDLCLNVDGGRIEGLSSRPSPGGEVIDLNGGYLLPGFIDTQVNGGGGVLFNDHPTPQAIAAIGAAHAQYGTTGFLPTLISDKLEIIDAAMRATEAAIATGIPGVLGIHIEGPFISTDRKGIHDPNHFRTLDPASKALLKSLKRGKTLVTLAPEHCTLEDIAELAEAGVILAAGHTNGDYETMKAALKAGITGFTHLYNAMSPFTHRAPGVAGAALEDQEAFCGLIMDGRHVHPAALRIALNCRPIARMMLVTDAMPTVGSSQKTFVLNGKHIHVEDGVCVDDQGTLAGSDLDMASALRYCVNEVGTTLEEAALMAAFAPAAFLDLGQVTGALAAGLKADLVWLDAALNVCGVWLEGKACLNDQAITIAS